MAHLVDFSGSLGGALKTTKSTMVHLVDFTGSLGGALKTTKSTMVHQVDFSALLMANEKPLNRPWCTKRILVPSWWRIKNH